MNIRKNKCVVSECTKNGFFIYKSGTKCCFHFMPPIIKTAKKGGFSFNFWPIRSLFSPLSHCLQIIARNAPLYRFIFKRIGRSINIHAKYHLQDTSLFHAKYNKNTDYGVWNRPCDKAKTFLHQQFWILLLLSNLEVINPANLTPTFCAVPER